MSSRCPRDHVSSSNRRSQHVISGSIFLILSHGFVGQNRLQRHLHQWFPVNRWRHGGYGEGMRYFPTWGSVSKEGRIAWKLDCLKAWFRRYCLLIKITDVVVWEVDIRRSLAELHVSASPHSALFATTPIFFSTANGTPRAIFSRS